MTRLPLTSILACTLLCGMATGCLMNASPPPPPFHLTQYGAGFDVSHTGKRFVFENESGTVTGQVRVSSHSLRLQHPDATAIGSVRITADGYAYRTRGGEDVCTLAAGSHAVTCGEDQTWQAAIRPMGVRITDPSGHHTRIPVDNAAPTMQRGASTWSPLAASVLAHDFAIEPGKEHTFGALALLAWSLRDAPAFMGPPHKPATHTPGIYGPTLPHPQAKDPTFIGPTRHQPDAIPPPETKTVGKKTQKGDKDALKEGEH